MRIRSLRGCECWLLLAASVTVAFIYLYTSQSERDKFESEYYAVASLIVKSLRLDMRSSFLDGTDVGHQRYPIIHGATSIMATDCILKTCSLFLMELWRL
jgi:hypothetical protein